MDELADICKCRFQEHLLVYKNINFNFAVLDFERKLTKNYNYINFYLRKFAPNGCVELPAS